MDTPALLSLIFQESYDKAKEATDQIGHEESIRPFEGGGNSMHWMVGHMVVSRCNFMMLLDVPSIWDWATCKLFIPGSSPGPETNTHIDFANLLADLDRTQAQLTAVLSQRTGSELDTVKGGTTIGEELATYAAHESYHSGQLALLRQWLGR